MAKRARIFVENILFGARRGKRAGQIVIMVAVTHDQRPIRTLRHDQMHPVGIVARLFGQQLCLERRRLGQRGITGIARQRQIAHQRGGQAKTGIGQPQHRQAAAAQAVGGDPVGPQRRKIVARTDHDTARRDLPARSGDAWRNAGKRHRLGQDIDPQRSLCPACELRNRQPRFDAQFVRAVERAEQIAPAHPLRGGAKGLRRDQAAMFAHFGIEKRRDHRQGLGRTRGQIQPAMFDRDPRQRRDFRPHIARSPRQRPRFAAFLPGHGDEPEIADRSTVGAPLALDQHHALARARRRDRVRQPEHAAADYRQIIDFAHWPAQSRQLSSASPSASCNGPSHAA